MSRRIRCGAVFDDISTAALFGCGIGALDFVLFDLQLSSARISDFLSDKAGLWSPNYLLFQMLAYACGAAAAAAILLTLGRFLAAVVPALSIRGAALGSAALLSLATFGLRYLKAGDNTVGLVIFGIVACVLSLLFGVGQRRLQNERAQRTARAKPAAAKLVALAVILAAVVIGPELVPAERGGQATDLLDRRDLPGDAPNVVVILLDTVRADRLPPSRPRYVHTPNIDFIASSSLQFEKAYSPAPWTLPAHASIFTGLHTLQHHADWGYLHLQDAHLTLAEHLRNHGYDTVAISENPFVGRGHGLDQGFDHFFETWRQPLIFRAAAEIAVHTGLFRFDREYASRTTGIFTHWFVTRRRSDRPFFAFLNYMAPHLPRYPRRSEGPGMWGHDTLARIEPVNLVPELFYLPEHRLGPAELEVISQIYDQQIEYLDRYVGELVGFLDAQGSLDRTVLIVTSDHGENFGEHGLFEHQFCLYDSLIRVPLLIRYPRLLEAGVVPQRVSTIALFSTIAELTGTADDLPTSVSASKSLHTVVEDTPILAEYTNGVHMLQDVLGSVEADFDYARFDRSLKSVIIGDFKLIWSSNGVYELYNLADDPDEEMNVAGTDPVRFEDLKSSLGTVLARFARDEIPASGAAPQIDSATADALRALGYLK